MSTLEANNIKKGTKTVDTDYVLDGCAKAWANLNGTGTIAVRDSLNVSSVTDNGTGDYTVNYTNSFATSNDYLTLSQCSYLDSSSTNGALNMHDDYSPATSYTRFICQASDGSNQDRNYNFVSVTGDLA